MMMTLAKLETVTLRGGSPHWEVAMPSRPISVIELPSVEGDRNVAINTELTWLVEWLEELHRRAPRWLPTKSKEVIEDIQTPGSMITYKQLDEVLKMAPAWEVARLQALQQASERQSCALEGTFDAAYTANAVKNQLARQAEEMEGVARQKEEADRVTAENVVAAWKALVENMDMEAKAAVTIQRAFRAFLSRNSHYMQSVPSPPPPPDPEKEVHGRESGDGHVGETKAKYMDDIRLLGTTRNPSGTAHARARSGRQSARPSGRGVATIVVGRQEKDSAGAAFERQSTELQQRGQSSGTEYAAARGSVTVQGESSVHALQLQQTAMLEDGADRSEGPAGFIARNSAAAAAAGQSPTRDGMSRHGPQAGMDTAKPGVAATKPAAAGSQPSAFQIQPEDMVFAASSGPGTLQQGAPGIASLWQQASCPDLSSPGQNLSPVPPASPSGIAPSMMPAAGLASELLAPRLHTSVRAAGSARRLSPASSITSENSQGSLSTFRPPTITVPLLFRSNGATSPMSPPMPGQHSPASSSSGGSPVPVLRGNLVRASDSGLPLSPSPRHPGLVHRPRGGLRPPSPSKKPGQGKRSKAYYDEVAALYRHVRSPHSAPNNIVMTAPSSSYSSATKGGVPSAVFSPYMHARSSQTGLLPMIRGSGATTPPASPYHLSL